MHAAEFPLWPVQTHDGAVLEELQPMGRSYVGAVSEGQHPVEGTRGKGKEVRMKEWQR